MKLSAAIRSEYVKVKHSAFWKIHIAMPILGALLFCFYFIFYPQVPVVDKLKLILECIALVFPLLIAIVVGLNTHLEERASHFHVLISVPSRKRMFLAKLTMLFGTGLFALVLLFLLFLLSLFLTGRIGGINVFQLFQASFSIAYGNLILYLFHLIICLKFGLGLSLFLGVFESLQIILYSNIHLQGAARFIPFSWSVNAMNDILFHRFWQNRIFWLATLVITIGVLLIAIHWFNAWEGRKNDE